MSVIARPVTLAAVADMVDAAALRLAGVATRTPLQRNDRLSDATGAEVWLKREDLQPVRSYKLRGAYNLISQLSDSERAAGVICASAGNHGQGVAMACQKLRIRGRIFVPNTTPRQKRDRMIALGGDVIELVVTGDNYDEAAAAAKAESAASGSTLVPAFDDVRTVAGQGTVVIEIIQQLGQAPDVLLVPCGGGGMLAGCAAWMNLHHPQTRVVGIEPAGAACMLAAILAGEPVELRQIDSFVDGAAVKRAGDVTYGLVAQAQPEIIAVPEGQVSTEMLALYQTDGIIAEPAGALASASLGGYLTVKPGQTVVAILSGGNNDVSRYAEILEKSLVHQGRKHYFLVNFPQEPGALRRFLDEVLGSDDDITYFEYVKKSNREVGPALVGIELGDPAEFPALMERMDASSLTVEVVSSESPFYRFLF